MNEPEDYDQLNIIRANLNRIKKEKKISLRTIAAAADIEHVQVDKFLKGTSDVTTMTLIKMVRGLGVTLADVIK
ncbi:Helix-turn-helix [Chitinophaga jiangningensis]|uniref:Helix-turn-helix n=1 Tax=Chitinophaga jiangningensis TaxID=1419482 RepID=A0A1M6XZG7_9BACT|nr:helix-turn-helix transcriptional regulator [Chitinophaga jiangningensis]SHL11421.1 Helix-turn-helix [Chitinophaga jiangningensis]